MNSLYIKGFTSVRNNSVRRNGEELFAHHSVSFEAFAGEAYRHFNISYPKFHKMDHLSQLGFLASEVLLEGISLKERYGAERTGMVLANKSSSLDTDIKYHQLLKKGIASPAVFVYSLPNIVIGEISIRQGIKGENAFFISDAFDIGAQVEYVESLFREEAVDVCLCGWVELLGEKYETFLCLVGKDQPGSLSPYTIEDVTLYYNQ